MFKKNPKNQRALTVFITLILILSIYQTYSLITLSLRLNEAKINFAQNASVNLSGGSGSNPDMVGGC